MRNIGKSTVLLSSSYSELASKNLSRSFVYIPNFLVSFLSLVSSLLGSLIGSSEIVPIMSKFIKRREEA